MTDKYSAEEWYYLIRKKYKLSVDDMDEYIASYDYINGGSEITPSSLYNFIIDETNDELVTSKESRRIINKINLIACGKSKNYIDLQTYLLYIIPICNNDDCVVEKTNLRDLFDKLDKNKDNTISRDELYKVLQKINKNLTSEELQKFKNNVDTVFKKADVNNDDNLNYDEFKNFCIQNNIFTNDQ